MSTSPNDKQLKNKAFVFARASKLALDEALLCCKEIKDLSLEIQVRNEIKRILDGEEK